MLKTSEIQIRDPFIVKDDSCFKYYMYGTTDTNCWDGPGIGFDFYVSSDLVNWDGPFSAFRPDDEFWGKENFWAPEVHKYKDKYYMFATFKNENSCRGTAILVSESLDKPFIEHSKGAVTPDDWECLDGTLFVDDNDKPWIVFCHEWQQIYDGTICAAPLSDDLSKISGKPTTLFSASQSGWAHEYKWHGKNGYITDGPCLFKHNEKLIMLWSSFVDDLYAIGIAISESGNIEGPWEHLAKPIYLCGGHCMIFEDFSGRRVLTFHQPNNTPDERAVFLDFEKIFNQVFC